MLAKIFGWFWIIMGVLFLIKPQLLRRRLQVKSTKKLRKALFLITLFLAVSLILASFKAAGILPKIITLVGIIGIFKAFFFLKSKAAESLIAWISRQPLKIFRFGAVGYIIMGLIILNFL